jgi:hypothetical protein
MQQRLGYLEWVMTSYNISSLIYINIFERLLSIHIIFPLGQYESLNEHISMLEVSKLSKTQTN